MKELVDKMNAVLTKVQSMSVQFDMVSSANNEMDTGNVEGAKWPTFSEQQMDEKIAPQTFLSVGNEKEKKQYPCL